MSHPVAVEHEYEPIPGLPGNLPEGEEIIWQGRPTARTFARHVMKVRWLLAYFGLLVIWAIIAAVYDGRTVGSIIFSVSVLGLLGAALIGLCELYAWGVQKTTLYTITNERIVLRIGVALSMTLNIPFRQVEAVNRSLFEDGTGTLTVKLLGDQRFSVLVLWPHLRPWKLAQPEPALRCIADLDAATNALLEGLSQHSTHASAASNRASAPLRRPDMDGVHPEMVAG